MTNRKQNSNVPHAAEVEDIAFDADGNMHPQSLDEKLFALDRVLTLAAGDGGLPLDEVNLREILDPRALDHVRLDDQDRADLARLEARFRAELDRQPRAPADRLRASGIRLEETPRRGLALIFDFTDEAAALLSRAFGSGMTASRSVEDLLRTSLHDLDFVPEGWIRNAEGEVAIFVRQCRTGSPAVPDIDLSLQGASVPFEVRPTSDPRVFALYFSCGDFASVRFQPVAATGRLSMRLEPDRVGPAPAAP